MFSVGLMTGFTLCSLVNTGSITWRDYYVVILSIAGLDFILQVFYLGRDLSVIYMFKEKQSEIRIRNALGSYLSEDAADQLYFEQREGHKANLKAQLNQPADVDVTLHILEQQVEEREK